MMALRNQALELSVRWSWQRLETTISNNTHLLPLLRCLWQRKRRQNRSSNPCQLKMILSSTGYWQPMSQGQEVKSLNSPGQPYSICLCSFQSCFWGTIFLYPTWFLSKDSINAIDPAQSWGFWPWNHFTFCKHFMRAEKKLGFSRSKKAKIHN